MLDFVMLDMRMYEMQYLDITLGTAYKKEFSYQQIQLQILYVSRVTDPNEYDELLREVLSAALAADIAYAVTSSNPVAQNMYQLYQEKLKDARFVDATEGNNINPDLGSSSVIDSNTFINSRF
jgi:hypothetical protein